MYNYTCGCLMISINLKFHLIEDVADGLKLTRLGLELVNVDKCPLCEAPWAPGKLKYHLKNKIKTFEVAVYDLDRLTELLNELKESADNVKVMIKVE
jgi:hypothetical protein